MDWQAIGLEIAKVVGLALLLSTCQLSLVIIFIRMGWAIKLIIWIKRRFLSGSDEGTLTEKAEDKPS